MQFAFLLITLNFMSCEAALRIIGARDVLKDEFPFAIRLERTVVDYHDNGNVIEYEQFCTGAAVTSKWILTAAHCYSEEEEAVARYNSYFPIYMGQISPILKVYIHPQYKEKYFDSKTNDVALYLSENILSVSEYGKISAIDYKSLIGHKVNVLGFGGTNASASQKPLQVLNGMLNNCLEIEKDYISSTVMCVVPLCGLETTICGGDSGGPVVHSSGIVGVNSMSMDDCNEFTTDFKRTPGTSASMVAMISHALDWVSNVISNKDFR